MPAVRWSWKFDGDGHAEQIVFAVQESTEDVVFDVSSIQPIWARYVHHTLCFELFICFELFPYNCTRLVWCQLLWI